MLLPRRSSALLLGLALGCSRDKSTTTDPNRIADADTFCKLLFEAPKRGLEASCSAEDKTRDEYGRLVALASRPVAACVAALEPSVRAARLQLHRPATEACARAIEKSSWKTSLRTRDLGTYAECKGLTTGAQAESAACRTSLDCQPDLWCAGASFQSDGVCKKRELFGAKCEAPVLFLFNETSASCAPGSACDFGSFRPAYALGYPPLLSAEVENERAKPTISDSGVRSDAVEFGMTGLGGSTEQSPWGRGNGIGLGSIGSLGGSFGTGNGRLGSSPASKGPSVRLGATTVAGRLPPEVIQRIVRQSFGRFRLCYEQGLRTNPKLEGKVSVRFQIGRDGKIANVTSSGDLTDKTVVACVTRAFQNLSFPEPEGGIVTVTYPIVFSPGDAPPANGPDAGATTSDASAPSDAAAAPPEVAAKTPDSPLACIAARKRGETCAAAHHCADGLSCRAGHCEALGKAKEPCGSDIECGADLYCGASVDESGARGICKPLGATGASCTSSSECRGACGPDHKCVAFCGAGS